MPTYEVFLKPEGRDGFAHAGSLDAPDDELAALYCRETYVRRGEGTLAWVVRRDHVIALDEELLAVTSKREHAMNDGSLVAERRRANAKTAADAKRAGTSASDGDQT